MARGTFILVCALFAFQASGMARALASPACRDGCPDDDASGHCPPACTCCSCCFHPVSFTAVVIASFSLPVIPSSHISATEKCPSSAQPRDILHVPKPANA